MSSAYMLIDFEFLMWKLLTAEEKKLKRSCVLSKKQLKNLGSMMIDVLSSAYVITRGAAFDIIESRRCNDTPLRIDVGRNTVEPVGQCDIFKQIDGRMFDKPEVRENLLTQLFETTFEGDLCQPFEHSIDPTDVIRALAPKGLTIVLWQGGSDMKILRPLLGATYDQVDICNVESRRVRPDSEDFELTLCRGSAVVHIVPLGRFPTKRGHSLNLTEAHDSVCDIDHGYAHDPLVDCQMLLCVMRRCSLLDVVRKLF